jgi:hypothetical protein
VEPMELNYLNQLLSLFNEQKGKDYS